MATNFAELIEAHGRPGLLFANRNPRAYDDPYLLVRAFVSVPKRRFEEARVQLEAMGMVLEETGTSIGPLGGVAETVEVAVAADVAGLSEEALERAVSEQRVLGVSVERSMGSGSVALYLYGLEHPVGARGVQLLFDPPCRLEDDELPHADAFEHESIKGFLGWQWYFTRALALPPGPARARGRSGRQQGGAGGSSPVPPAA